MGSVIISKFNEMDQKKKKKKQAEEIPPTMSSTGTTGEGLGL